MCPNYLGSRCIHTSSCRWWQTGCLGVCDQMLIYSRMNKAILTKLGVWLRIRGKLTWNEGHVGIGSVFCESDMLLGHLEIRFGISQWEWGISGPWRAPWGKVKLLWQIAKLQPFSLAWVYIRPLQQSDTVSTVMALLNGIMRSVGCWSSYN